MTLPYPADEKDHAEERTNFSRQEFISAKSGSRTCSSAPRFADRTCRKRLFAPSFLFRWKTLPLSPIVICMGIRNGSGNFTRAHFLIRREERERNILLQSFRSPLLTFGRDFCEGRRARKENLPNDNGDNAERGAGVKVPLEEMKNYRTLGSLLKGPHGLCQVSFCCHDYRALIYDYRLNLAYS